MSDMLKVGLAWLSDRLIENASEPVTYARGYDFVDIRAAFGRKLLKLDDNAGGIRMEWTDMDFLIRASDLLINGVPITPMRGDKIFAVIGEQAQAFEVLPYGNDPPWRWADPYQSMYRIHTKHVDTESLA